MTTHDQHTDHTAPTTPPPPAPSPAAAAAPPEPRKPTADDIVMSLDWFEEIAIERAFGRPIEAMVESQMKAGRALAFILVKREQRCDDATALAQVKAMPFGDVQAMFGEDDSTTADDQMAAALEGKG